MSAAPNREALASARDEVWQALGSVAHYADIGRGFLEVGDDAGAVYAVTSARERFIAALESFRPIREAMKLRGREVA
jgi:hypothetical protein